MANVIKIKRSTVPGKVPLAGDLEVGELAINTADGALYTKHNDNSVKQISANLATVTLDYVTTNGNTATRPVTFSNSTPSTSNTTGAVIISGGLGVGGNVYTGSAVYAEGYFYAGNLEPVGSTIELAPANIINSNVVIASANTATLIDSVSISGISSVKWSLVAVDTANNYFKASQIDSVNDGTDVYYNEYGIVLSNSNYEVATFTSNINNGNIRLFGFADAANTAITFQRTTLGSAIVSGSATTQTLSAQRGYTGSAGSAGYTGSASTEVGYTGSAGSNGSSGATGYTGSAGSQGTTGYVGSSGTNGTTGYTGSAGTNGTTGYTGSAGSQGTTGYTGSRGDLAMVLAVSDETTSVTTGTAKITFRAPYAMTLTQIPRASLSTVSTSGLVTVDINENGTSILGANKLSIDANEKTSTTAATATTLADSSIADDAEVTIDIDAAGTGAKGLKVVIYYSV